MDSTTTSPQSTAVSRFAEFLRQARNGTANINIPKDLSEAFGPVFNDRDIVEEENVEAVVSAIDSDDETLCKRLDVKCLSAEFLHQDLDREHPPSQDTERKKKILGLKNMIPAFKKFLDDCRSDQARRACGFFVSTLLTGNQANRKVMADECSDKIWRDLGKIILSQEGEMIKLLAGSIIREMLSYGLKEDRIWPVNDTPAAIASKFPRDPSHTSQWIWDFHSYLEHECPQDRVGDQREVAMFAHVVRLPDIIFEMEDESAILVTINTALSVLVPANLSRSAIYLDIPFDRILNIKMSKSDSQSQRRSHLNQSQTTTPCCMDIELTESLGWSHLMNYKARQASSIGIVFDYMPDAIAVNEALAARKAISHDDNVSPSQLQYDPRSPITEASTDRQNRSLTSEPATSTRVLQAIEADAITCIGDDEAHGSIAESRGAGNMGTPQTDRNTALDSAHVPAQVKAQKNTAGATNSVTAESKIVPGSRAPNITHLPAARGSSVQEKSPVHIVDDQQEGSESDPPIDSSPKGPKLKYLRNVANPTVLQEQNEVHQVEDLKPKKKGLSRNLGDHNELLKNAERVRSHNENSPEARTDTDSKQASASGRAPAPRGQPKPQGASKARNSIVYGKTSGQRGSEFQKSDHDKVYEPAGALDQRGKKSRAARAPEASMVAQPNNNELQRKGNVPINTSNISRPRPKTQFPSIQAPQRPSGSKVKKTKSPSDEEEQVNWFEDIIADDSSDNATPIRKRIAKRPDISTEPKKRKAARARNNEVVSKKSAASQSTRKPRRAAAVKADMKIRGLADPVNTETVVKNTVDIESASENTPSPGVKPSEKPDISLKVSNQVEKAATRLKKDLSRQPPNVRALTTSIGSPALPESSPSSDPQEDHKSDPLPADGVVKPTNPPESNEDIALPTGKTEFAEESRVETDAVGLGTALNGRHDIDKDESMAEIATEDYAMDHSPDFSVESPLKDAGRRPHAKDDRSLLQPQARNTAAALHKPKAIMSSTIEETKPMSTLSELNSKIIHSGQREKNRGDVSGVHVDSPRLLLNQTSKLSYHKSRSSKDFDHGASAFSDHLRLPRTLQKLNDSVIESGPRRRSTNIEHGFTARKLEAALSPIICLQAKDHDVEARSIPKAARDGKWVGEMGKEARRTGRTVEHQTPNESRVKAVEKRRIDEEDPRQAKKSRAAGWQPQQDPHGALAEIRTPKNNVPELRRKPVVVHFEASGPKYERTQPLKKSKVPAELTIPQSKQDQNSSAIQRNKRKPLDAVNDDPWTMDDLPSRKRRKGDPMKMQPISRDIGDALAVNPTIHSSTGQVQRHSSQSSRVNEQGSPMPTVYSRKMSLARPKVITPTPKPLNLLSNVSGNEEYYNFDDDAPQIPESSVHAAQHDTPAQIAKPNVVVGRNAKHRPSSPNASSSIIADMTAHRIQPSGRFVGVKTNDVVVPQKPQDPFVETAQNQPASKFLEILHKCTEEQKMAENMNDNGRHKDRSITAHLGGNDPEKTLIEENVSEAEEESSTASGSSSSSFSSESQSQADAEPSDDGSGSESAWNKALRDDQRDIFEKLHEISHVFTRDLIDKETAIKDMIKDYRQQGDWIIDRVEEDCQRQLANRRAERNKANAALLETFRSVEEDCAKRVSEAERNMVELRSSMASRQATANASIQALEELFSNSE